MMPTHVNTTCALHSVCFIASKINTLRPRQNGRHFKMDFPTWNVWILIKISLNFVPKVVINNIRALVQIMFWSRPGNQTIISTNDGLVHWRIYASFGLIELNDKIICSYAFWYHLCCITPHHQHYTIYQRTMHHTNKNVGHLHLIPTISMVRGFGSQIIITNTM